MCPEVRENGMVGRSDVTEATAGDRTRPQSDGNCGPIEIEARACVVDDISSDG